MDQLEFLSSTKEKKPLPKDKYDRVTRLVFSLCDSWAFKQKTKTLNLFQEYTAIGDGYYLLSMLARQLRLITLAQIGGLEGQSSFVREKVQEQSANWSKGEIIKTYEELLQLDEEIKMGLIQPFSGIFLFLMGDYP